MRDERWHLRAVALPGGDEPADWWIADGRLSTEPVETARQRPAVGEGRRRPSRPGRQPARPAARRPVRSPRGDHRRRGRRGRTTGARAYLGPPAPEPGAPADLVTFDRDPREDVAALATPAAVVAGGRAVRVG